MIFFIGIEIYMESKIPQILKTFMPPVRRIYFKGIVNKMTEHGCKPGVPTSEQKRKPRDKHLWSI